MASPTIWYAAPRRSIGGRVYGVFTRGRYSRAPHVIAGTRRDRNAWCRYLHLFRDTPQRRHHTLASAAAWTHGLRRFPLFCLIRLCRQSVSDRARAIGRRGVAFARGCTLAVGVAGEPRGLWTSRPCQDGSPV